MYTNNMKHNTTDKDGLGMGNVEKPLTTPEKVSQTKISWVKHYLGKLSSKKP